MGGEDIPVPLKNFIRCHIHSVEQLEVLLQLGSAKGKDFSAAEICRVLKTSDASVQLRLEDLRLRRLAVSSMIGKDSLFRLVDDERVRASVDQLGRYYASHRVTIVELIFSRPAEAVHGFADAFLFHKKP